MHRKTPVLESFSNKVSGLKSGSLIKKRLQHRCFPVKNAKFLRAAFYIEHLRWLVLNLINAKRYEVSSMLFIVHFETKAGCVQNLYAYYRLKNHILATTKTKKSVTLYEVKHQNSVDLVLVFCCSSLNFELLRLANTSFATLSIYLVGKFNFANVKTIALSNSRE